MINETPLLVDAVNAVMRIEQMRAQVAARNLALANVPGHRAERFDAALQYGQLRAALADPAQFAAEVGRLGGLSEADLVAPVPGGVQPSPDALVLEMSAASGRYQALAEGVSRQFALMRLAIGGGR